MSPRPQAPAAPALERDLQRLEEALCRGSQGRSGGLAALGDPQRLAFLLRVLLGTLLRRGPQEARPSLDPGRLVEGAAAAAARGEVPLETLRSLRSELQTARRRLVEAGAWRAAAQPWWGPLPPPSLLEIRGEALGGDCRSLDPEDLRRSFGGGAGKRRWWVQRRLLEPARTRELYRQLEEAHRAGELSLEPGAVGARGEVSIRRSDFVGYFDGLETPLLESAPAAAFLIQRMLEEIPEAFRKAFPKKSFFAPQKAMLARYPAPSGGYAAHLDNPGGERDNHRLLTLVLYLNPPEAPPAGGGLALWRTSAAEEAPDEIVAAVSGTAALFDSRKIPHQVLPLRAGPPRWALTLWLSDLPQAPPAPDPPPPPSLTDLLLPLPEVALPEGRILFHHLEDGLAGGEIRVESAAAGDPRAAIVCTTYGAGDALLAWSEHHLALGFARLLLIFDHLQEPPERALADRLRDRFPGERISVWDGDELLRQGWPELPADSRTEGLRRIAAGGASSHAHAARQTLNAGLALERAQGEGWGGDPPHWLLHLDSDELFHLDGPARGGGTLKRHFTAAREAGLIRIRYVNHELLLPWEEARAPRFKMNPRLAAARLGTAGWRRLERHLKMSQGDPRPYFRAYHNGKSAVAVAAAGAAGGVHGWELRPGARGGSAFLAGPSILHFHLPTAESFRRAYRAKAEAPQIPAEDLPFSPSPLEEVALEALRRTAGAEGPEVDRELDGLYARHTHFSPSEVEFLSEAGLLLAPSVLPLKP